MSYKAQIEWLKKNHFVFNIYDYTKTSENQSLDDGINFRIDEEIKFVIQTGDAHVPIVINNEIFVSKEDAEKDRIPEKIIQTINFGGKVFTNEKTRQHHHTKELDNIKQTEIYETYANKGDIPASLSTMIDRIVEKRYSSEKFFLQSKDYEEYQAKVQGLDADSPTYEKERESILTELDAIKKDFQKYGAIDKDLVKDFLEEDMEQLKALVPEGESIEEIQDASKLLRKLIYRSEEILESGEVFAEIEEKIKHSFDKISAATVKEVTLADKMSIYREMQIKFNRNNIEKELALQKENLSTLQFDLEDREDFLRKFTKIFNQRSKDKSISPDDLSKDKRKIVQFRESVRNLKNEIIQQNAIVSNLESTLQDIEAFVDGKTSTRMRLVPPVLFDMIMNSQLNTLEGMERQKQADLNQALTNTTNPQGFMNLLQKFSGEEQASIVYFAMNNTPEKIDNLIQAHEQRKYDSSSEYAA